MIEGLKPYPAYKASGLPWLGRVPVGWEVRRLSSLFTLRRETPLPNDQRITGYLDGRVTLRTNVAGQRIKGVVKEAGWQRIHPGDFAISGMNAHLGGMGVSDSLGKCSPIYLVLTPKRETNAGFVALAVRHLAHRGVLGALVNTIRFNSADFKREDLKTIGVLLPSISEQAAIVRFLDHACGRIEKAIRVKRKMIALLNEQKQAIIHRAVTRGLDPDVPLKPSGVPWLGDIPAHWKVVRAKTLFREVDQRSTTGQEELLSVSHITGVTPRSQKNITMFKAESYIGHKICQPGDLVVNTMWAWMGALGVSQYTGIVSSGYAVYRPTKIGEVKGEYVDALLRTSPYIANIRCHSTGVQSSRLRLYPPQFLRLPIVVPPGKEQVEILKHIERETTHLRSWISILNDQITLLREYRTRLVADVVTGKVDVREAAARLPDEAPTDLEPALDDAGDLDPDAEDIDDSADEARNP